MIDKTPAELEAILEGASSDFELLTSILVSDCYSPPISVSFGFYSPVPISCCPSHLSMGR